MIAAILSLARGWIAVIECVQQAALQQKYNDDVQRVPPLVHSACQEMTVATYSRLDK
jgi:hypothetical protein